MSRKGKMYLEAEVLVDIPVWGLGRGKVNRFGRRAPEAFCEEHGRIA